MWTGPRFLSVVAFTCKPFDADRAVDVTRDFFGLTSHASQSF